MAQEELAYYGVGNKEDIVVSSSILKYIDPLDGGSPQAFINAFEKSEQEEKKYLRIGKMIHKWAEDKENFHVSAVAKPSEKLGIVADAIVDWCLTSGEELSDKIYLDIARRCQYQNNYKDDTLITNVKKGTEEYVTEVISVGKDNKIYLSKDESIIVESACNSINKHPQARELLFLQDNDFSDKKTLKEVPIFWTSPVPVPLIENEPLRDELIEVKQKALLDDVTIDLENRKVTINDLKTTSAGSYSYGDAFSKYKTWRQLGFYKRAVMAWSVQNNVFLNEFQWEYNIISVETNGLFQCVVHSIDPLWISHGIKNIKSLLTRVATHIGTDNWNYSLEEVEGNYKLWLPFTEQ